MISKRLIMSRLTLLLVCFVVLVQSQQQHHHQGVLQAAGAAEGRAVSLCRDVHSAHPSKVLFRNSLGYRVQQRTYWTLQQAQDLHPQCRLLPASAEDVSSMLESVVEAGVPFAIKSGGHTTITGASNIDGTGVTFDLSALSSIELSKDKRTVRLGTGARWADVYDAMEPHGLSVAGGRAGVVGVGGFLLGGGVSWFSNRHGWSCDSVEAFEVVLANGDIVEASRDQHTDLFWALKGGGGIFGLVTSFHVRTIASNGIWGGGIGYADGQERTLVSSLINVVQNMEREDESSVYLTFAHMPAWRNIWSSGYLVDLAANPSPSLLEPLLRLPRKGDTLRTMNMSDSAAEMSESTVGDDRYRHEKFALTFHADVKTLEQIYLLFAAAEQTWPSFSPYSLIAMTFQPLSASHLSRARGDNALGFGSDDPVSPLILCSFEVRWQNTRHDDCHKRRARKLHDDMKKAAKEKDTLHRFVYANYAAGWQDVYEGYGEEASKKLKEVKERYDKEGIFSVLRPGGLKLL